MAGFGIFVGTVGASPKTSAPMLVTCSHSGSSTVVPFFDSQRINDARRADVGFISAGRARAM